MDGITPQVNFCHAVPSWPLSRFIALFWYCRGHTSAHSKERILPTGSVQIVIDLREGRFFNSVVSGAKSTSFIIERSSQDELLGIHFRPGGLFPFIAVPSDELHNIDVALSDLYDAEKVDQLLDRLHTCRTIEQKFRALEVWMLAHMRHPLGHHPAVAFALNLFQHNPGLQVQAHVAQKVNLSPQRLIQLFRKEVGLTPKLFCRTQRFQKVLGSLEGKAEVNWAELATGNGYFDQAHFIHEFRELSGITPSEYMKLRTASANHVALAPV